jgi:hypothetical protein
MRNPSTIVRNLWPILPALLAILASAAAFPAFGQQDKEVLPPLPGAAVEQPPPSAGQEQQPSAAKALQSKSGKIGTSEPNVHTQAAQQENAAILVNGRLNVPGAPEDGETVPAKFSERNAARDELPIMAQPLHLSTDQRRRIWDLMGAAESSRTAFDAEPAQQLPATVELQDVPRDVAGAIPEIAGYKFAHLRDKVLLVQSPSRVVVGEVARPERPASR